MLIYVIDDEKAVLAHTEKMIKSCFPDDEVVPFLKSREMLAAFTERPADIVYLDIEMPGLSGIELARTLHDVKENVNIIFVTGYEQYAYEAFNVYASDYMKKPCSPEKIMASVKKLRYPISTAKALYIRTFGNFDVFYNGTPLHFRSEVDKQLLAYLVDREGALVSRAEMAGILYEDDYSRTKQVQLTRAAARLTETLNEAGVKDFFFSDNGSYHVDVTQCDCDLLEWKKGNPDVKFAGEYMEQYSFGELRKSEFS